MSGRKTNQLLSAKTELDRLALPTWIAEMRRHFAEHGTLRPKDVARLRGGRSRATGALAHPSGSTASLLQQMARKVHD